MAFEMQKKKGAAGGGSSAQDFLAISEIKHNVIVMKDGGLRAVIAISSINFSLKSPDEQNAIISSYQSFLNTLEFPVQILIQSRKLDVHAYLDKMREKEMRQTNELLRVQTEEYIEYIAKLTEVGNIMNKTFYIIIPHSSGDPVKAGLVQRFKNLINPTVGISVSQKKFEEEAKIVEDRVARVTGGISGMGLRCMRLTTQELVELLYNCYNIGTAPGSLVDVGELKLG